MDHVWTYVYAVYMFSKFLFTVPLVADDACTVSEGLYILFVTFGTCDTLISDKGTDTVTQTLCHLFQIKQESTPTFMQHCLGACECTRATIAAKRTPFLNSKRHNWDSFTFRYICYEHLCGFYWIFSI